MKRLSKKKAALLALCVCSAIANSGFAAEAGDLDIYGGEEFVVTATKTPLEEKKVPMAVQVVTEEKMQALGATNVLNALSLSDSLNLSNSGMAGNQVQIRGMSTNHTLILVDGKRMAGEDTSVTQNVYALSRMSLSNIERIEIIRGAASAMYGSDALGGVINIITKNSDTPSTTVGVSTGTTEIDNWYNFNLGKQGKFKGNFDMRFNNVREYNNGSGGSNLYGPRQEFNFKGAYEVGKDKEITLDLGYYNEHSKAKYADASYTYRGITLDTKKDNVEWYDYKRYDYSLGFNGRDEKNDYMLRAFYSRLEKENRQYNNRETFPTLFMGPVMGMVSLENMMGSAYPKYDWDNSKYTIYGIEGRNSQKLDDKHTLTYGAEYRSTTGEGTRLGDGGDKVHSVSQNGVSKYYSEKDVDTYSLYVQDQWQVNDKLYIIPALRYDHDSSFGGETTPKIGATYMLNNNSRVKANWGKSFKAPTISELYMAMHRSMGGGIVNVYGNPDLEPEEATSWDISYEAEKDNTYGKITYFNNKVTNLIDSQILSSGGGQTVSQYVNVDEAQINGVEFMLGRQFDKHWGLKGTFEYLDAKDKSDDSRLNNKAKETATLQLTYSDAKENPLTMTLWAKWYIDYLYQGGGTSGMSSTVYNNNYTYGTLNFAVNKQINKNLRIFAALDNIFDKTFTVDDTHSYDIYGRTWRVGAEMTF
ncbi:MAG: TonB-dependent receptor [Phascolarctobacterium sp.]|uniref:TonB-dependent receptor plug domain-containing protein n=1 Tax=Phascolarctobacterium sp. TaxID=2049039 RepID=UPI0026DD8F9D|nr:TonB-dependent receptor [Phascolarctobacterium sp.]MDO4920475.1 TonB-dependent receptor [Phascolarctobacterium sp.]